MKKLSAFIIILACVLICASRAFAWSDDVEGMLMPSPRGEDNISDPEAILENIYSGFYFFRRCHCSDFLRDIGQTDFRYGSIICFSISGTWNNILLYGWPLRKAAWKPGRKCLIP